MKKAKEICGKDSDVVATHTRGLKGEKSRLHVSKPILQ